LLTGLTSSGRSRILSANDRIEKLDDELLLFARQQLHLLDAALQLGDGSRLGALRVRLAAQEIGDGNFQRWRRYNPSSLSSFRRRFEPLLFLFSRLLFFDKLLSCARCAGCNYPFLTAKERDIETGLDYFGARYYASMQGRFTGPDPISIGVDRIFDPQRFNRYAYARNNPLIFTDPDGRDIILGSGDQQRTKKALVEIAKRPGGRKLLQKMDKLTIQIMISTGELPGRLYGSIRAQDRSKNSFERVRSENGSVVDIKGDPLVITLNFKLAEADRKENETRTKNNEGWRN
jgi:RHS repeat-associated protein